MMRKQLLAATALAAALVVPSVAAAKGPESASVSGPGLERSVAVVGQGEMGNGTPLGALVDSGGFFAQMFGQVPDPTLRVRPAGRLGAHYIVTYVVPGPNGVRSRVVQHVYPFAKPGPLTYMRPGQHFWDQTTHGGWYRGSAALRRVLVQAGVHQG